MSVATAFQTIGPYWHLIEHPEQADLTRFGAIGDRLTLVGRIVDGDRAPVADACVELWQASPDASPLFPAWGRARTDANGEYRFTTVKPGPVPGRGNTLQAQSASPQEGQRLMLKEAPPAAAFLSAFRSRPFL